MPGMPSKARGQDAVQAAAVRAAAGFPRPGDQIVLQFVRERELNETVTVDERGEAVFPRLGVMPVSGMTIGQLQDTLRARYGEYLRFPDLQVAVLRRVIVNGEVRLPNVYHVDNASTLRDVLAKAGGLTEAGNRKDVVILRGDRRIPVHGWDLDGTPIDLQSGDQIIVGRKNWWALNALAAASTGVFIAGFFLGLLRR